MARWGSESDALNRRAAARAALSKSASAQDAILLEPGLGLLPGIFCGVLAVAAAVVGMEPVRRFRIDLEFGRLLVLLQGCLELLDLGDGNAGIGAPIEAEHRCLHLGRELHRAFRPQRIGWIDRRTVEGDAGLEAAAVSGIFPDGASAPAEADDAELTGVAALRSRPRHRRGILDRPVKPGDDRECVAVDTPSRPRGVSP